MSIPSIRQGLTTIASTVGHAVKDAHSLVALSRTFRPPAASQIRSFEFSPKSSDSKIDRTTARVAAGVVKKTQLYNNVYKVCSAAIDGIRNAMNYSPQPRSITQSLPPGADKVSDRL